MEPNPGATEEAASGLPVIFKTDASVDHRPRLEWARIAGIAVAISVNGFAVFHVSLPPSERSTSVVPLELADRLRHALVVELIEAVVIDPPEERAPPFLERTVSRPAPSQLPPVAVPAFPESEPDPSLESAPRLRFGLSQLQSVDEAPPVAARRHDPKAAAALFYRRPAITYEATRFDDAWQPTSLAERGRQSTFSYARHCSLSNELRQVRGCSRDERNATAAAMRGARVDTAIRPDSAVD
jgi:hypothetical protein